MSLNFSGWSLVEAVRRTSGSTTTHADEAILLTMLERGQLVAFGRLRAQSNRQWITAEFWNSTIELDFVNSSASGTDKVFDLRIYPVLHAPNAFEFLDGKSLKDAFWRFVLHDPEVQCLAHQAMKSNPALQHVYMHGWCHPMGCREWPVRFDHGALAGGRSRNSPIGFGAGPLPEEVQQAANVVCERYDALLAPLRKYQFEAVGDFARSRGTDQILPSVWSHRSYYIDVQNGDLVQLTGVDPISLFTVRWRAVMLKRVFPVKPTISDEIRQTTIEYDQLDHTPAQSRIAQAIKELWPMGIPEGLKVKARDRRIVEWLQNKGLDEVSPKTIERYMKTLDI